MELIEMIRAALELGAPAIYLLAAVLLFQEYKRLQQQCENDKAELRKEIEALRDAINLAERNITALQNGAARKV